MIQVTKDIFDKFVKDNNLKLKLTSSNGDYWYSNDDNTLEASIIDVEYPSIKIYYISDESLQDIGAILVLRRFLE